MKTFGYYAVYAAALVFSTSGCRAPDAEPAGTAGVQEAPLRPNDTIAVFADCDFGTEGAFAPSVRIAILNVGPESVVVNKPPRLSLSTKYFRYPVVGAGDSSTERLGASMADYPEVDEVPASEDLYEPVEPTRVLPIWSGMVGLPCHGVARVAGEPELPPGACALFAWNARPGELRPRTPDEVILNVIVTWAFCGGGVRTRHVQFTYAPPGVAFKCDGPAELASPSVRADN